MPNDITKRFACWCALALSLLALGAGCLGTPLPDPPSFSAEGITLRSSDQPGTVRLVGDPHAVSPGGITLRITTPPSPGVLVATNADGSFGRIVPGMPGERIFFEFIDADEDRFVGAFMAPIDGRLVAVDPGPDGDADGSPDLIDCAPADESVGGQRCVSVPACTVDSDCATGQLCSAGVCVAGTTCRSDADCLAGEACVGGFCRGPVCEEAPESCNGIDDDCNGIIDDGDPGGGVACTTITMCPGAFVCEAVRFLTCVASVVPEVCGNGLDDDCDGLVDDGC